MSQEVGSKRERCEDVLLGGLGFDLDAKIVFIERFGEGFRGRGSYSDGEEFEFENEEPLTQLEEWALETLLPLLGQSDVVGQ